MSAPQSTDSILDELLETTFALVEKAKGSAPEQAAPLIEQRNSALTELKQLAGSTRFTPTQLDKLRKLIELGREARQPFALRREAARNQLIELRAVQRVQEAFKPYRSHTPRRIDMSL